MKRPPYFLLVLFAFTMISTTVQAQSPVEFGLRGGLNLARLMDIDEAGFRTGFMGGVYLHLTIPMSPVSIQPELLYTQKGTESSIGGVTGTVKLDYIEVPVLARIGLGVPGPVNPHLYAGPYAGLNINAEAEVSGGGGSTSGDIDEQVKDTDFGLVVGAGADLNKLSLGIRNTAGLINVYEDGIDGRNSVLSVVAGIRF
jgi:hypothetical protein